MRSTLDPDNLPRERRRKGPPGHETIGPSDSSDSGSDLAGGDALDDDDSDRSGTGERTTVEERDVREAADVDTDRIVGPADAGVGFGLDEAELAERDARSADRD